MNIKKTILLLICLVFCITKSDAFGRQFSPELNKVKSIYVGKMGEGNEAERFRLLLSDELSKKGFDVIDNQGSADAVLTGILSLRVYADTSIARATVALKDRYGKQIWGDDFEPKYSLKNPKDTVKFRAQNIASALRKDCNKSSKE